MQIRLLLHLREVEAAASSIKTPKDAARVWRAYRKMPVRLRQCELASRSPSDYRSMRKLRTRYTLAARLVSRCLNRWEQGSRAAA